MPRPVTLVPVPRCLPARPLTWADFTGPVGGGTFGAFTSTAVSEVNVQGNTMFQARLVSNRSWVRPRVAQATNRASNGCAPTVGACQHFFAGLSATQTGTYPPPTPSPDCPATIPIDPAAVSHDSGECGTVLGTACDAAAVAESARLLAHEQGHFDLTCALVSKANDALAAGVPLSTVRTRLNALLQPQHSQYDSSGQTGHGCNQGAQDAWLADIAAGLPNLTIP